MAIENAEGRNPAPAECGNEEGEKLAE